MSVVSDAKINEILTLSFKLLKILQRKHKTHIYTSTKIKPESASRSKGNVMGAQGRKTFLLV